MTPFQDLDTAALALITADVALLNDGDLTRATPCTGWYVADLLQHMTERHDAVSSQLLDIRPEPLPDARRQFAVGAAQWTLAMTSGGDSIQVPGLPDPVPRGQVLAVHFVDMLTHRWDLAKAVGRPTPNSAALVEAALPVAHRVTAAGSPLVGTAYQPSIAYDAAAPALDQLVALLGRDPAWSPARPPASEKP